MNPRRIEFASSEGRPAVSQHCERRFYFLFIFSCIIVEPSAISIIRCSKETTDQSPESNLGIAVGLSSSVDASMRRLTAVVCPRLAARVNSASCCLLDQEAHCKAYWCTLSLELISSATFTPSI